MNGQALASSLVVLIICIYSAYGQRVAEKKCSEFREQTVVKTYVNFLLPGTKPVKTEYFNCSKTVNLIIGGEEALPKEFPHQAVLGYAPDESGQFDFRCGGSLISDQFVITAGHCLKHGEPEVVRLGESDLSKPDSNQRDFAIEEIIKHPKYRFSQSYHDLALIKLKEKVKFSEYIRPACLWAGQNINVTSVIATGFGFTEQEGSPSKTLRKVQLDFMDKAECEAQFLGVRVFREGIIDGQLCIGNQAGGEGSKDTCSGDSGGPIQVVTEPKGCIYHIIAVTSVGGACGVGRSPSIYTQVAAYIDWIEKVVWNAQA